MIVVEKTATQAMWSLRNTVEWLQLYSTSVTYEDNYAITQLAKRSFERKTRRRSNGMQVH